MTPWGKILVFVMDFGKLKLSFTFQVEIMESTMTDSSILIIMDMDIIQMKMMDLTSITSDDGQNPSVCLQTPLPMAGDSYLQPTEELDFRLMPLPHTYLHTIWAFLQNLFNLPHLRIIIE